MSLSGFSVKRVLYSPSGGMVVINGGASSYYDPGNLVHSGVAFNVDGECYDVGPGVLIRTIFTSGEWWSDEPDTGIGSSYDVRCASIVGGTTWSFQAATVGTWIQMSSERVWRCTVTAMASPSTRSCTGSFEIRNTGSGTALDTANYSGSASN